MVNMYYIYFLKNTIHISNQSQFHTSTIFLIGFLIVKCNPNYQLPSIKNKKTTAKEMSAEFEEFVQRFWCQPEKRSNNDNRWGWDNSISNQLKNGLEVEIQKRAGKL